MPKRVSWSLAIETSGRVGGVAVGCGDQILEAEKFSADLRHAVELLPAIDAICQRHGLTPELLEGLFVSAGPGSFTGVRIGMTVARLVAWAGEVAVVRVPTLDVIAQNVLDFSPRPEHVGCVLDAKRKHVFAAAYGLGGDFYHRLTEPAEYAPDEFFGRLPRPCALVGEGLAYVQKAVERSGLSVLPASLHRARSAVVYRLGQQMLANGQADRVSDLIPIYVRRPEAEEVWERRHGQSE